MLDARGLHLNKRVQGMRVRACDEVVWIELFQDWTQRTGERVCFVRNGDGDAVVRHASASLYTHFHF